ncbi:xanthine dehydrogenase small subunit [Sneathiella marina]|uniref:Xanthine dehydrogenase small subunit n=1 Tax=Sneathiella marina TaxID=2950108 RepID=A0ABY4WCA1_9PROT|nr:xanthine dehydrogenase small subunit [Sneathiella marina]USG62276.1 xanthine dehydrogenase small subunit [Sneathiella marina]
MRQTLRFVHRGEIVEMEDVDPTKTVLNFLRYEQALTGTKEGCAEGDCGACSVVVGEIVEGDLRYQAVNACIQFLPTLDGKELITVEDLKSEDGGLHPVQEAMVARHGTQCGFCTPGFVMSMFAEMHSSDNPDRGHIDNVLAGNLCRCTGYGPIIQAAQDIAADKPRDKFHEQSTATLELLARLENDPGLHLSFDGRQYFAPKTSADLAEILGKNPEATILAGATDVGLWVTKLHRELATVVYVGQIAELKTMSVDEGELSIGAGVTYSEAWATIASHYPDFGELIRRIASTQIRNTGTIGGNIANGSPIGDTPPALIVLNARLRLRSAEGFRDIPLEDFFIEYGKQDLRTGEFVERLFLPLPEKDTRFSTYKISKRFDQDISAVCAAFHLSLNDNKVDGIRICYGGMAGTPLRAKKTEAALLGQDWSLDAVERAMRTMTEDYQPMSDMRASKDYRMMSAQNLLKKFFIETTAPDVNTRIVGEGSLAYA